MTKKRGRDWAEWDWRLILIALKATSSVEIKSVADLEALGLNNKGTYDTFEVADNTRLRLTGFLNTRTKVWSYLSFRVFKSPEFEASRFAPYLPTTRGRHYLAAFLSTGGLPPFPPPQE